MAGLTAGAVTEGAIVGAAENLAPKAVEAVPKAVEAVSQAVDKLKQNNP